MTLHRHSYLLAIATFCFAWVMFSTIVKAQSSSDCIAWVRRDAMEGFLNKEGQPIFPLQPYRLSFPKDGLIIANSGTWEANHYSDPDRLCPRYVVGNSGILNLKGEWVVPMASQWIGYWGNGLFWTCKNGKIAKYCSEPHHVEGGRYAIVNAGGVVIDSLDDLAVPLDEGFSLLYRNGKIAVMDSSGQLRHGFDFDFALHWSSPRYPYPDEPTPVRLWKIVLRRDGHWYSLLPDGALFALDWPSDLGVELRTLGWRKRPADWISDAMHVPIIAYPISMTRHRTRPLQPRDLSFAENLPNFAQRNAIVKRLRDEDLHAIGLQIIEHGDMRALADASGKLLTPFSHQDFKAAGGTFVLHLDSLPIAKPAAPVTEPVAYSWCCAPPFVGTAALGVVDRNGKTILPPIYERIDVFPQWGIIEAATQTEAHVFLLKDTKIIDKIDGGVGWGEKDLYVLRNRDMYEVRNLRHRVIYRDSNNIAKPAIVDGWLWYLRNSNWFYGKKLKGKGILGPYASDSIPIREIAFLRTHPVYDCPRCSVKPMGTDRWLIMQGDSVGLSDSQGQLLLSIVYDQITLTDNWIYVILDGKEGMMDLQGKPFIPAEYDSISPNDCGSFSVSKTVDGKLHMGILDRNGHWVSKLQME